MKLINLIFLFILISLLSCNKGEQKKNVFTINTSRDTTFFLSRKEGKNENMLGGQLICKYLNKSAKNDTLFLKVINVNGSVDIYPIVLESYLLGGKKEIWQDWYTNFAIIEHKKRNESININVEIRY
ncbi:hypothetical protein [Flectobacillus major]|uniref:hypothetical protein n=1 Tax=Flectobacillus major TaxID=103 RepID=UPI00047E8849|nr:hypothetical protein [Flectobacillus major]